MLLFHQVILYILDSIFLERTLRLIMKIDNKIRDENFNIILTKKQQK